MTVERSLQPLLIEVVTNETNATTENKEAVESTNLDVLVSFLWSESTTVTEQVDEANGNATVDVEDELEEDRYSTNDDKNEVIATHCIFLGSGHFLDGEGIVEQAVAREVFVHVLLDELDTEIGVVNALDLVTDTRD